MLQYTVLENLLTPAPDDYMAQPVNVRTYDLPAIFQRISARYPGLTPTQISSAVYEFFGEVVTISEDGGAVNTPLFHTQFSMPGVYEGAMDSFDSKRHSVKLNLNSGTLLRNAVQKVKLEKVVVSETLPHILEVKDMTSEVVNETLTPGGVMQLRGAKLKFLKKEDDNGVFLINEQDEAIKLPQVIENKPSRIMAMLPADLPQGAYFVELRTTFAGTDSAKPLHTLKTSRFNKELTVSTVS
jgi:hypothetical protein